MYIPDDTLRRVMIRPRSSQLTAFRGPHGIPNNPASYGLNSSPGVLDIDGLRESGLNSSFRLLDIIELLGFPCVNELFDFHMFIDLLGGCPFQDLQTKINTKLLALLVLEIWDNIMELWVK